MLSPRHFDEFFLCDLTIFFLEFSIPAILHLEKEGEIDVLLFDDIFFFLLYCQFLILMSKRVEDFLSIFVGVLENLHCNSIT